MKHAPQRLIVAISGASGAIYGVRALEMLRGTGIEIHLVVTRSAQITLAQELSMKLADLRHCVPCPCTTGAWRGQLQ